MEISEGLWSLVRSQKGGCAWNSGIVARVAASLKYWWECRDSSQPREKGQQEALPSNGGEAIRVPWKGKSVEETRQSALAIRLGQYGLVRHSISRFWVSLGFWDTSRPSFFLVVCLVDRRDGSGKLASKARWDAGTTKGAKYRPRFTKYTTKNTTSRWRKGPDRPWSMATKHDNITNIGGVEVYWVDVTTDGRRKGTAEGEVAERTAEQQKTQSNDDRPECGPFGISSFSEWPCWRLSWQVKGDSTP